MPDDFIFCHGVVMSPPVVGTVDNGIVRKDLTGTYLAKSCYLAILWRT